MALKSRVEWNKEDLARLDQKLNLLANLGHDVNDIAEKEARVAVRNMEREAPVDTGRLKREINAHSDGRANIVFESEAIDPRSGRDYAPIQEYGLYGVTPQPYFDHNVRNFWISFTNKIQRKFREVVQRKPVTGIKVNKTYNKWFIS